MTALTRQDFSIFLYFLLLIRLGDSFRHILPTPTFGDLRAVDVQFDIQPTPNPWTPSDISKRLANDPAICGWVEGNNDASVSCGTGYTCANVSTFVGCCSTSTPKDGFCDALYTTCYNGHDKSCDAECSSNIAALICDRDTALYCATYRYASGSLGFGCAESTGFNKTVLTVTGSSALRPTPFGQDPSTTSTISTSTSNSATTAPVKPKHMSGGAIAGTIVGSVVGVAAIILVLLFLFQRFRKKQSQRQRNQTSRDRPLYDQYGKPIYLPPWSHQGHTRHQSDGHSELEGALFSPDPSHKSPMASPSLSEVDGRPFSPETIRSSPLASHGFSDGGQHNRPAELPGAD